MAAAQRNSKSQSSEDHPMSTIGERKTQRMAIYRFSVRVALGHESQEYQYFLRLFEEWEQNRITTPVVVAIVKLLFSDKQELIERFNHFLPVEHKISFPLLRRRNVNFEGASGFIKKLKRALDKERYLSFLRVVDKYRKAQMNILELSQKICELLEDRQDLLLEFVNYLPAPLEVGHQRVFDNTIDGESSQKRK